jgi:hypothetical protein
MSTLRAGALVAALAVVAGCTSEPKKDDPGKPRTQAPGDVDMRDYLQGVLLVAWPKDGAGLKVGDWLEVKNVSGGKTTVNRIAVVAAAGDLFKIEEQSDGFLGFIEGLTVQKADGKVVEAIAAKKGEKGKPIKLGAASIAAPSSGTTTEETVTVAAGNFASRKTVIAGQLSETSVWVGKDGDARGIVVKEASDDVTLRELKALALDDYVISGRSMKIKALHATYSDGSESWFVRDAQVPFYGSGDATWVKQSRGGTTTELSWGDGAKPDIDWAN